VRRPGRPIVTIDVEVEFHIDVTDVFDLWPLDEVYAFVQSPDDDSLRVLREEGYVLEEEQRQPSFSTTSLGDYLAWRRAMEEGT
jgi:hypothetical protein